MFCTLKINQHGHWRIRFNYRPRITEDGIRFMENMLRATGKFHIVPKYQMEEEEEEDLEEVEEEKEDYSLSGQQGQIEENKHTCW